jgi:hypothetical protein
VWYDNWKEEEKDDVLNSQECRWAFILVSHWLILSWLILLIGFVLGLPDCVAPPFTNQHFTSPFPSFIDYTTFFSVIGSLLCVPLWLAESRVWQARAANLWGGGQDAPIPEEDSSSDWSPGGGPTQPQEPTGGP